MLVAGRLGGGRASAEGWVSSWVRPKSTTVNFDDHLSPKPCSPAVCRLVARTQTQGTTTVTANSPLLASLLHSSEFSHLSGPSS